LVITVAVSLAWNRRRRSPNGQVEPPGSHGEHRLQRLYRPQDRARRFYRQRVLDRLNEQMIAFICRQEMVWIATADGHGECDCSFRAGPPGFVQVLDASTLRYPEYRGNGGHGLAWQHLGEPPTSAWSSRTLTRSGSACTSTARPGSSRPRTATAGGRGWNVGSRSASRRPTSIAASICRIWSRRMGMGERGGTDDARAKGGDYFGASCEPQPWVADS
jgi:uncharacterized protein